MVTSPPQASGSTAMALSCRLLDLGERSGWRSRRNLLKDQLSSSSSWQPSPDPPQPPHFFTVEEAYLAISSIAHHWIRPLHRHRCCPPPGHGSVARAPPTAESTIRDTPVARSTAHAPPAVGLATRSTPMARSTARTP
ncbi:Os02g0584050 [Oryza sativa Japonica Group]|uniref:Os02g0584050 protein n=1 Tax=Oryza sativa subsp. japonica TaxID=39947 RepID=A0A0P0VL41_ORYSJ|nr:hypothetical protein DAI22_02g223900 [Oryza sativa Japonica Group]BAS79448.1 Os02g0584050 [Oryza sativa Japonica Group]